MTILLTTYIILMIISMIIYAGIIISYTYGWYRLNYFVPGEVKNPVQTSIIIPARNEEHNIDALLHDLLNQTLPKEHYEVIVVDDHSSDNTIEIVKEFQKKYDTFNLELISLSEAEVNQAYKKKAIGKAIEKSVGELIITTDADCRIKKNWLKSLLSFYDTENPSMIVGPVCFDNETTFFQKMQSQEFLSLIAITAGAIRINHPIMCNGANLAYKKSAYHKAGGFAADRFSSGDDVFLMLKIRELFGRKSIRFIKNPDAIVSTEAKKNLKDFIHQRVRWASKNKGYSLNILAVSFTVYLVNLLIITGLISAIFIKNLLPFVVLILFIKIFIDVPILIGINNFTKKMKYLVYSFPLIVLYPLYIVLTGALGIIGSYTWKDRQVKN